MDNYAIKLSGKAELPEAITIGYNFHIVCDGSIVSETIEDNDDGTKTHYYKFKPTIVETIDEMGTRLKARDIRSRSQQLRALLWKIWRETNEPVEFNEFYDKRMLDIMKSLY